MVFFINKNIVSTRAKDIYIFKYIVFLEVLDWMIAYLLNIELKIEYFFSIVLLMFGHVLY